MRRQFPGKHLDQAMHCRFCLSIRSQSRVRLQTLIRPGEDDRASSTLFHQGDDSLTSIHMGKEVERKAALPLLCAELLEPLCNDEAHVGYQDIDGIAERREDL